MPPSLLATALVLQTYDGVSDDEATRRAAFDLQWKVALGVEVKTRPFAKSTLQEFRAQLIVHDQTRAIFQRSLEMAKRRGVWKKGQAPQERQHIKVALDTTYILGRGAVKDTYNMLADGIVQVLRALAELAVELLELAEELGCTRYVSGSSLKGQAEVDWTDPKARQQFLAQVPRVRLGQAVAVGHHFHSTDDDGLDLGPLATSQRHHRTIDADLQDVGSSRSDRPLTLQPLQVGGLDRHVGRAGDFGVVPHTGFADVHAREMGQLCGGPFERHPGAQMDQIFLQAWTQRTRQQLQFLIQGEKDPLRRPAARVVASQVDLATAMRDERALLLALALQHLPALRERGCSPSSCPAYRRRG